MLGFPGQVGRDFLQEEFDFRFARLRFEWCIVERDVRRSDEHMTVPGDGEDDAAVVRFRNEQRRAAG